MIKQYFSLRCNGCGRIYRETYRDYVGIEVEQEVWPSVEEVRKTAFLNQGWKQVVNHDYCPECASHFGIKRSVYPKKGEEI